MEISNNQIETASLALKEILTKFYEETITLRSALSEKDEEKMNRKYRTAIIQLFTKNPTNNTIMGRLRGYLRKEIKTFLPTEIGQVLDTDSVVSILRDILGASKHAMNGVNILETPMCSFKDEEEKYHCDRIIDFGYKYCKDHYSISELKKE